MTYVSIIVVRDRGDEQRDLGVVPDRMYTSAMTGAERIAELEGRVAALEKAAHMRAKKLDASIAGVIELKQLNRELARLNDIELHVLGKPALQ